MKRELMNAVTRFAAQTAKLEKLQDEVMAVAVERARLVVDLAGTMTHEEVGRLLGISKQRVGQLIARYLAAQVGGGE